MNYATFKSTYVGTKIDYDKAYGFQCVDLVRIWAKEGWGLTSGAVGGSAKFAFTKNSMLKLADVLRTANADNLVPLQGSIIVFDSAEKNKYGHIAIVDSANVNEVSVLEQNGGSGTGDGKDANAIRLKTYKYSANSKGVGKVLGWLTPKSGSAAG